MSVRFLPAGDTGITVEFGDRIDRELNERVLHLSARVREAQIPGVVETLPTFRSLTIHYDPLVTHGESVIAAVERLLDQSSAAAPRSTLWRIPVCYAETHAPDLADVARRTGLDRREVVRLHAGTRFRVYMVGFSPGFPYMGDLPAPLVLPRRTDPRVRVPAGSVAIAAGMTAIYPVESPGGWHLIGATPVRLFDLAWPQPALLSPGDMVRFEPINTREFDLIRADIATHRHTAPHEAVAPP